MTHVYESATVEPGGFDCASINLTSACAFATRFIW